MPGCCGKEVSGVGHGVDGACADNLAHTESQILGTKLSAHCKMPLTHRIEEGPD
jgi:hypothetical protein